jgi:hypothetical protein
MSTFFFFFHCVVTVKKYIRHKTLQSVQNETKSLYRTPQTSNSQDGILQDLPKLLIHKMEFFKLLGRQQFFTSWIWLCQF